MDQPQRARENLKRAGQLDPRYARSYWQLARLEFQQGHHARAWAPLQRFLRLGRPTREALEMAAELALERGDSELAGKYRRQLASTGETP